MPDAPDPADQMSRDIELDQPRHLTVTVLLDNVNPIILLNEFDEIFRKWHRAQPVITDREVILAGELIA